MSAASQIAESVRDARQRTIDLVTDLRRDVFAGFRTCALR
jgi:hypothetical protein